MTEIFLRLLVSNIFYYDVLQSTPVYTINCVLSRAPYTLFDRPRILAYAPQPAPFRQNTLTEPNISHGEAKISRDDVHYIFVRAR